MSPNRVFPAGSDLVDAMELGCSLGPIEVWVESIRRESWQQSQDEFVQNHPE
jgi:hypothetical protein